MRVINPVHTMAQTKPVYSAVIQPVALWEQAAGCGCAVTRFVTSHGGVGEKVGAREEGGREEEEAEEEDATAELCCSFAVSPSFLCGLSGIT